MFLRVWTNIARYVSTKYLTSCLLSSAYTSRQAFFLCWYKNPFAWQRPLLFWNPWQGRFHQNDSRFEVLIVCHSFCWMTTSNYLWYAQRQGDNYSSEFKIEFMILELCTSKCKENIDTSLPPNVLTQSGHQLVTIYQTFV